MAGILPRQGRSKKQSQAGDAGREKQRSLAVDENTDDDATSRSKSGTVCYRANKLALENGCSLCSTPLDGLH